MTLTVLTPEQASAVAEVEALCFSDPWSEASFREALAGEGYTFLGLWEGETLVGYGGMLTVLDTADVTGIAVRPTHRRQGLGRELLTALMRAAERDGVTRLQLEVRESNTAARALYRSLGFGEDGKRKRYYRRPEEDAVLMSKEIN